MSDSAWIGEFNSISKNIDEMKKGLDLINNKFEKDIIALKNQIDIPTIQQFKPFLLSTIEVNLHIDKWSGKYICFKRFSSIIPLIKEHYTSNPTFEGGYSFNEKEYNLVDDSWGSYIIRINIDENKEALNKAISLIDYIYNIDVETKKENDEIKKNNERVLSSIYSLMKRIGIHESYMGLKNNRSSKKVEMRYNWVSEIRNQIPIIFPDIDALKKRLIDSITKIHNDVVNAVIAERQLKEKKEQDHKSNKVLALLLAKYDLDIMDTWDDLLHKVLDKNKYLRLAYYLEKNRGDWNDGYSYAESGLCGFNCDKEIDHLIYDEIQGLIDNWDGDGRVFRDCTYNYNSIYDLAEKDNSDLYKDYSIISEQIEH